MNVLAGLHTFSEGFLPNVGGTRDVDPEADFDVIIDKPRPLDANVILVNAFGLGGQNASLIIRRPR
jgi:3-oxoacyl-[acyl-carrier-protein] synthase II